MMKEIIRRSSVGQWWDRYWTQKLEADSRWGDIEEVRESRRINEKKARVAILLSARAADKCEKKGST